jgi:branched-chain amino acid transport system substrate-binding protein
MNKPDVDVGTSDLLISRRGFLKKSAAAVLAAGAPAILTSYARGQGRTVKIGLATPRTGPLAAFAEADDFVLGAVRKLFSHGITIAGRNYPVQILDRDTRSNANRAAEIASQLIKSDKVDLILGADTPEVVNPVADQAEINGVPSITSVCPWQQFAFRGGKQMRTYEWNYHFFWGIEDLIQVYTRLWNALPNNKVIGVLWPNDIDGNQNADPEHGLAAKYRAMGFQIVDPGRFEPMADDFSAQISRFKQANVEILSGALSPPAFSTFWSQAAQQGFRPKIVTVGKATLFPAAVNALGERGLGLTTEVWWSPHHPFKSSLTGQSAAQLCAEWEKQTARPWTQPMGYKHALLEIAFDALRRTRNIDSPESIRDAVANTNLNTIAGHIRFGEAGAPTKNICKTPLVGGQWVRGKRFKYDLVIVNNDTFKAIHRQAALKPIVYQQS